MARYITIEREYGSGGRYIANKLANVLNIECYGRKILERAAEDLHVLPSDIEKYEENSTNSFIYSMLMMGQVSGDDRERLAKDGKLFVAEQKAIREFANNGPCIFLGHCASEALKDEDDVIKVFIKSDLESRKRRLKDEYEIPEAEILNTIKHYDKKRANYYAANTKLKWRDLNNYDIILDTSKIDLDSCVLILKTLYMNNR